MSGGRWAGKVLPAAVAAAITLGCEGQSPWQTSSPPPPVPETAPAAAGTETPVAEENYYRSRRPAPEDVEAFQNAVDRIVRLEYAPAEADLRFLLVRFESAGDEKYISQALFWLGYCCEKQGVWEQARDYYQRLTEHHSATVPGRLAGERLKHLPSE